MTVLYYPATCQPHHVFVGFTSISGGWMLLGMELSMAELTSMQHIATFECSPVLLLVSVCYQSIFYFMFVHIEVILDPKRKPTKI